MDAANLCAMTALELRDFSLGHGVGSPMDLSILDLLAGRKSGFPTERQSARLVSLVASANAKALKPSVLEGRQHVGYDVTDLLGE